MSSNKITGKQAADAAAENAPARAANKPAEEQAAVGGQGAAEQPVGAAQEPTPGPPPSDPAQELEQLRQQLAAAQEACRRAEAERAEAQEAKLRSLAELENFRRRTLRQMEEERRYALFPLLRDLLPVLDNLRRAIESAQTSQDPGALLAGVQLVYKQFQDVLQRHHCVEIEALGGIFDPNMHQAVAQMPSPQHPPGTILQVTQPGFRLHDRVIRPSLVVVAMAPAASEAEKGNHPPPPNNLPPNQSPPADHPPEGEQK